MTGINNRSKEFIIKHRDILVCLFLVMATLAVYWQVQNLHFVNFDDDKYIYENRHVQEGLTLESISWAFGFVDIAYWHPLTWLSHMLDCQMYGLIPGMHHRTSLIFHIVNSILLFFVLQKMTGALWKSAFVAALFALHPINVESVAWIAERKNLLSTFFWMLTMLAYVYYTRHPNLYRYLLTLSLLMLGLMAKPMLVTLPFVLLLLDYWPLGRLRQQSTFNLILEKIPFIALSAVSVYISSLSVQRYGIVVSMELVPMKLRLANALVSYVKYIEKMIWPKNLAVFYPFPDTLPIWQVFGAGLLLVSISFLVLLNFRKKPYLCIGWLWFLGTLIPVIGLKQAGLWPAVADRWAYVPLIGLFIIVVWGVPEYGVRWIHRKIWFAISAIIILSIFMAVTWIQIQYWADSITLFKHAIAVTDDNYTANQKVGEALAAQGKNAEAIKYYAEALRIKPDFPGAHLSIANALTATGKLNEAIDHYNEALRIKPDYADAHNNLGIVMEEQGSTDQAIEHYLEALRIKPDFADAHNNLGIVMEERGNIALAIRHYLEALHIKPDFVAGHLNLGIAYIKTGRLSDAFIHFSKALRIEPDSAEALNYLGNTLTMQGSIDEAVDYFLKALHIKPDYADAHSNLAIALFRKGNIEGAIFHFRKALEINPDHIQAKNHLKKVLVMQKQNQ